MIRQTRYMWELARLLCELWLHVSIDVKEQLHPGFRSPLAWLTSGNRPNYRNLHTCSMTYSSTIQCTPVCISKKTYPRFSKESQSTAFPSDRGAQYFILSYWRGQSCQTSGGVRIVSKNLPLFYSTSHVRWLARFQPSTVILWVSQQVFLIVATQSHHWRQQFHELTRQDTHATEAMNAHIFPRDIIYTLEFWTWMRKMMAFYYFWKISTYFGYLSNFRRKIH